MGFGGLCGLEPEGRGQDDSENRRQDAGTTERCSQVEFPPRRVIHATLSAMGVFPSEFFVRRNSGSARIPWNREYSEIYFRVVLGCSPVRSAGRWRGSNIAGRWTATSGRRLRSENVAPNRVLLPCGSVPRRRLASGMMAKRRRARTVGFSLISANSATHVVTSFSEPARPAATRVSTLRRKGWRCRQPRCRRATGCRPACFHGSVPGRDGFGAAP